MSITYDDIKVRAAEKGIEALKGVDLLDYEPLSDGCSGGLSRLYALGGREISCHLCCVAHDFLYEWGGNDRDRKKADQLLQWCAARAGSASGWKAPFRYVWRWARSWLIYGALRLCGGWWGGWAGK